MRFIPGVDPGLRRYHTGVHCVATKPNAKEGEVGARTRLRLPGNRPKPEVKQARASATGTRNQIDSNIDEITRVIVRETIAHSFLYGKYYR